MAQPNLFSHLIPSEGTNLFSHLIPKEKPPPVSPPGAEIPQTLTEPGLDSPGEQEQPPLRVTAQPPIDVDEEFSGLPAGHRRMRETARTARPPGLPLSSSAIGRIADEAAKSVGKIWRDPEGKSPWDISPKEWASLGDMVIQNPEDLNTSLALKIRRRLFAALYSDTKRVIGGGLALIATPFTALLATFNQTLLEAGVSKYNARRSTGDIEAWLMAFMMGAGVSRGGPRRPRPKKIPQREPIQEIIKKAIDEVPEDRRGEVKARIGRLFDELEKRQVGKPDVPLEPPAEIPRPPRVEPGVEAPKPPEVAAPEALAPVVEAPKPAEPLAAPVVEPPRPPVVSELAAPVEGPMAPEVLAPPKPPRPPKPPTEGVPPEPLRGEAGKAAGAFSFRERLWNTIERRFFSRYEPLGTLPQRTKYLTKRYLTLGKLGNIDHIATSINKTFRRASEIDQSEVYKYLTTKDAKPDAIIDVNVRRKAVSTKKLIENVGDNLVKKGLLSAEARDLHRGSYLPRVYLKYLLGDRALGAKIKTSEMGYLKKRKDIPKDVRDIILGEITDPGFLASRGYAQPARDLAIMDFLEQVSKERDWIFPDTLVEFKGKRVTAHYLKSEADRIRGMTPNYDILRKTNRSPEELKEAGRAKAEEMEAAARPVLDLAPEDPSAFKRIPDTRRYGELRGMFVRKEIYDDLIGASQLITGDRSIAAQILGTGGVLTKATQLWKLSKVALNPPTQIRNFVTNGILLHLSGVNLFKMPVRVGQALSEMARDGKHWKIAKKFGVSKTTFAANEMYRIQRDFLKIKTKNPLVWIREAGAAVANSASDVYGLSEALFKTAKIIDAMKRGATESEAALDAHKWVFDYSLLPPSVQYLRNTPLGVPFITFYYKALPRMLETAVKQPTKFLPYAALSALFTTMIANEYDVSTDDVAKLRNALPTFLREKGHAYILPFKDKKGRWQAMDFGYYFPWAMYGELAKQGAKGDIGRMLKSSGAAGTPIVQLINAIFTNVDPFTEKEIINENDPPERQVAAMMNYLWRMSAPTWLTDVGAANHLLKALKGETNRYGDPSLTVNQGALRFFGVNIYPIKAEKARFLNLKWKKKEIDKTRKRMMFLMRDRRLSDEEKEEIRREFTPRMMKQMEDLRLYEKESQVHERLK